MRAFVLVVTVLAAWLVYPYYLWGDAAFNLAVPSVPLPSNFWFWLAVLSAWTVFMGFLAARKL